MPVNLFRTIWIIAVIILSAVTGGTAERKLGWEDLVPASVTFVDPFADLEREQLEYLGFVARVRAMAAAGEPVSKGTQAEAQLIEKELLEDGIDINGLLARREEVIALRNKRARAVVDELDGESVRMPGYLLPLEYKGRYVKEFLLVPWVGACIHTPPPPPNQIVYVVVKEGPGFESKSIYEPVWVLGEISVKSATKALFLKDGTGDIDIGYKMLATVVEKYKQ